MIWPPRCWGELSQTVVPAARPRKKIRPRFLSGNRQSTINRHRSARRDAGTSRSLVAPVARSARLFLVPGGVAPIRFIRAPDGTVDEVISEELQPLTLVRIKPATQ